MQKAFVLFGLAVAVAAQVWAQDGAGSRPEGPGERRGWDRMQQRLGMPGAGEVGAEQEGILQGLLKDPEVAAKAGISEQQMAALRSGFEELKPGVEKLRKDLEAAALDQAGLMSKADVNEEALMKAVERAGAIRTDLAKIQMKALLLVRRTLSPEQIEKVKVLVRERVKERIGKGMREWRDRGGKDRQPGGNKPPPQAPSNPNALL